ncbi:NUDIX domain-containing protein [Acidicapsa dinghuensis]|uniref:GDP-mannose pyrophosphatase n=1 Tax=Acidicapsa dinghuensis TaxID=2218256 RepID=A0ABW1EAM8_9BACT|nr:NUDIX domain-containing protein [Acidicapsa dinghuensis]
MTALGERIRVHSVVVLSDDWYLLKKTTFDFLRSDGTWQRQSRETYDRGNGATILLYNRARKTVILTRQFRYPAYVNGHEDLLLETPAGLLDAQSPEEAIRKETAEETGYIIHKVKKVFEAFMSPGSVTEKLYFFAAEYDSAARQEQGGGVASDGEDIETVELTLDEALEKIANGEIRDGKTIMLLQYAKLHLFA